MKGFVDDDADVYHWWSSGQSSPYGLLSSLWDQSGNLSNNLKIKVGASASLASAKGNWNSSTAYGEGTIRAYPSGGPICWRVKVGQSVSSGENPPISNSKWELIQPISIVYDLGGGKYANLTVQTDEGLFMKLGGMSIGTYSLSRFSYNPSLCNWSETITGISTTSADSITTPSAHPASRTFTIGTGLTIDNSTSIGTCTTSFAIPTTHPTLLSLQFPTGQTIAPGQSVTFYGDANNFVVVAIARYDLSTGAAYGASILKVGSGTFNSWTIKKETLIRVARIANPTGNVWFGLIQSYTSGTGSITVNSTHNTGTGTFSGWTVTGYRTPNGPAGSSQSTFYNTNEATACWHVATFTGTSLIHKSDTDNRGTGWIYIYCDGPNVSSPPANVTIDTYSAGVVSVANTLTFDDLSRGTHTVMAVSTVSPSGLSSNTRAWIKASTNPANIQSYDQNYNFESFVSDFSVATQGQSVGEIAWKYRKLANAGNTTEWIPYHGNNTLSLDARSLVIDGNTVDLTTDFTTTTNPYQLKFQSFTSAVLSQSGHMIHYQVVGNLGDYSTVHTINKYGIDFVGNYLWTDDVLIDPGYTTMLFLPKQFAKKLKFGNTGNVYTPAGSDIILDAADRNPGSVLVYNDGTGVLGEPNYALANYSGETILPWLPQSFINNYDTDNIKLYPVTYFTSTVNSGTAVIVKGKWYLGNKGTIV